MISMSRIVAAHTVLPGHVHRQEEITEVLADAVFGDAPSAAPRREVMRRLHAAAGVRTRHLALPLDRYHDLGGFGAANDVWIDLGARLGEEAVAGALANAGLAPGDVDLVMTTSVTGLAVPSLDARIASRLGMRDDVKRMPMFGLGCVAGAAVVPASEVPPQAAEVTLVSGLVTYMTPTFDSTAKRMRVGPV